MHNVKESMEYDFSYRGIVQKDIIKVYTDKDMLEVRKELSFDIDHDAKTSLDYFATSVMSGIILHLIDDADRSDITMEDVEGKMKMVLSNPLSTMAVIGYTEEPEITDCDLTIYLYTNMEEKAFEDFANESLKRCFIFQTLKKTMHINLRYSFIA